MGVAYGHLHPHLLLVGENQSEKVEVGVFTLEGHKNNSVEQVGRFTVFSIFRSEQKHISPRCHDLSLMSACWKFAPTVNRP